jgi:hypothetical protein
MIVTVRLVDDVGTTRKVWLVRDMHSTDEALKEVKLHLMRLQNLGHLVARDTDQLFAETIKFIKNTSIVEVL